MFAQMHSSFAIKYTNILSPSSVRRIMRSFLIVFVAGIVACNAIYQFSPEEEAQVSPYGPQSPEDREAASNALAGCWVPPPQPAICPPASPEEEGHGVPPRTRPALYPKPSYPYEYDPYFAPPSLYINTYPLRKAAYPNSDGYFERRRSAYPPKAGNYPAKPETQPLFPPQHYPAVQPEAAAAPQEAQPAVARNARSAQYPAPRY